MSKLIANVHVAGHGWFGPAHGNAERVPAEAAALIGHHAWDQPPEQPASVPEPDGLVEHELPEVPDPELAPVPAEVPGPGTDAFDWLKPEVEPEVADPAAVAAMKLTAVPADKPALLEFAARHGVDVDGRLGVEKLRAAIAEGLASR